MSHKYTSQQHGFSILEAMIAVGLLGVVAVGILNIIGLHGNEIHSAKNVSSSSRYGTELLDNGSSLLLETKLAGVNNQGLCRWVNTTQRDPGVGKVMLTLPATTLNDTSGLPKSRWDSFFPNWNVLDSGHKECKGVNNYNRCLTLKIDSLSKTNFEEAKNLDFVAEVSLVPTYINPNKGYMKQVKLETNARVTESIADLGFEVKAEIYYNRGRQKDGSFIRSSRTYRSFVWAPSAGTCDVSYSNRPLKLSLSGMGASDPTGQTMYNLARFTQSGTNAITVDFIRGQAQEGQIDSTGQFLSTNRAQSIEVSCNEKAYQCPKMPSNQRSYREIDMQMRINYEAFNSIAGHAAQMTLQPKIEILRGSQDAIGLTGAATAFYLDGSPTASTSFSVSDSHVLQAKVRNRDGDASNMCRMVCNEKSDYNTSGRSASQNYIPVLTEKYFGYDYLGKLPADQAMGCTACYMKNCAQVGLGTFGRMANQPYQPLDSNIPECWQHEPDNQDPYSRAPFIKNGNFSGEGCVAARLGSGDTLELLPQSCSTSLPALCYNYGTFALAQNISTTSRTLRTGTFEDASQGCFDMGFEIIRRGPFDNLAGPSTSQINLPVVNGNYQFINVANQGLFLAPQIAEDIEGYRKWAISRAINSSTTFWTNLRYKNGAITAQIPLISANRPTLEYAVIYNPNGFIEVDHFTTNLSTLNEGNDEKDPFLLFHHIRYKGAWRASATQSNAFAALCMRDNIPVVTVDKFNNVADAPQACKSINAEFRAPKTPVSLLKALLAVAPPQANSPFPAYQVRDSAKEAKPVWMASSFSAPEPVENKP